MTTASTQEVLLENFGFSEFRPGQEEIVDILLKGSSAAAVFPTGGGKSLCYQLPAIMFDGLTLVVSPLLALMKDQVDALLEKGIAAARLDSSLSAEEYSQVLKDAREGRLKLLYVAPERFNNERFRGSLSAFKVSLMAVDEAHCVSEWGHNFRPDYLKLSRYAKDCSAERVLALTATATPQVLSDICQRFDIKESVRTPFHRQNLHLKTELVSDSRAKLQGLLKSLKDGGRTTAIVYVTLQRTAEEVAQNLCDGGLNARPYHAGLDPELRMETQDWFLQEDSGIVVATIAFGMGIDKANIRAVYHYDPPKSLENYSQEIGRAGRDGQTSLCKFFYFPPDRIPLENFVYGDTPTQEAINLLLEKLFSQGDELVLNLYQLSRDCDLRPLVLRTLLTYLELDGYLQALTPVYSTYKFKPSAPSAQILASYQGEDKRLLTSVLKHSVKKRIWFEIDIEKTASALKLDRVPVVRILDRCGLDGWLEIKASNLRYRYAVKSRPESLVEFSEDLTKRTEDREGAEIDRLGQALGLPTLKTCLAQRLAAHFGEDLDGGCGTCSVCLAEDAGQDYSDQAKPFELPHLPDSIADSRTAARFLCGLTSPALQKLKLTKHEHFGGLGHISFARVHERLRQESTEAN